MGKVIGRLPVVYDPAARRVQVESSAEFVETQLLQRLDDLAHGQPLRLTLAVEPERKGRSTQQNRLMWSLLTIMADAYNAGRTGGVTPEECYLDMLQKYGAKVDYLEVPAGALEILRRGYRLVHVVEILDNNRCTVKCTQGRQKRSAISAAAGTTSAPPAGWRSITLSPGHCGPLQSATV